MNVSVFIGIFPACLNKYCCALPFRTHTSLQKWRTITSPLLHFLEFPLQFPAECLHIISILFIISMQTSSYFLSTTSVAIELKLHHLLVVQQLVSLLQIPSKSPRCLWFPCQPEHEPVLPVRPDTIRFYLPGHVEPCSLSPSTYHPIPLPVWVRLASTRLSMNDSIPLFVSDTVDESFYKSSAMKIQKRKGMKSLR